MRPNRELPGASDGFKKLLQDAYGRNGIAFKSTLGIVYRTVVLLTRFELSDSRFGCFFSRIPSLSEFDVSAIIYLIEEVSLVYTTRKCKRSYAYLIAFIIRCLVKVLVDGALWKRRDGPKRVLKYFFPRKFVIFIVAVICY